MKLICNSLFEFRTQMVKFLNFARVGGTVVIIGRTKDRLPAYEFTLTARRISNIVNDESKPEPNKRPSPFMKP